MDDEVGDPPPRVHQEPGPAVGGGRSTGVLAAGGQSSAGAGPDVGRAFPGRWHAGGSLGGSKSFQPKDQKQSPPPDDRGNPTVNFHGERRSNDTHESTTDPDARLARKGGGKEAKLSYHSNLLVENRNGLIVDTETFEAHGTAERDAGLVMLERVEGIGQIPVG